MAHAKPGFPLRIPPSQSKRGLRVVEPAPTFRLSERRRLSVRLARYFGWGTLALFSSLLLIGALLAVFH